jgi:hypothetical protein
MHGRGREAAQTPAQEGALWKGTPARELEPTATYRLGVDLEEQSAGETPLGKFFQRGVNHR